MKRLATMQNDVYDILWPLSMPAHSGHRRQSGRHGSRVGFNLFRGRCHYVDGLLVCRFELATYLDLGKVLNLFAYRDGERLLDFY